MKFNPDYAVPPGVTLKECINADNWARESVIAAWIRKTDLSEFYSGKEPITEELAEILEFYLDPPKEFWLTLEKNYRDALARGAKSQ